MIVLKERLDALRVARNPNAELHLRPDDASVRYVHSSLEAERIGELNQGDRIMQFEQAKLRQAINQARLNGAAKTRFNNLGHTHALNP